jgi:hypothetical protein
LLLSAAVSTARTRSFSRAFPDAPSVAAKRVFLAVPVLLTNEFAPPPDTLEVVSIAWPDSAVRLAGIEEDPSKLR